MSASEINDFIRQHFENMTDGEIADLLKAQGITASEKSIRGRRRRMGLVKSNSTARPKEDKVNKIAELLEKSGISVDEIGKVEKVRVSTYQMLTKNDEGEAETHDLEATSLVLSPTWQDGPKWPVVQVAEPVQIKVAKRTKPKRWGKTAVILPDPQFGFRRDLATDRLDPFHDERAISVALQIVEDLQPEIIINIGDLLDLAEFSRFIGEAAFARTTQASLNAAHRFLAMQRALVPNAEIMLFSGNHETRIERWIKQNGMAAFGLQRANEPESWPVMSIPNLLALDTLDITYIDGYPASSYYINDRLKVKHGSKTGRRGTVANKVASDEQVSTITGHTHGLEMVYHTVDTRKGPRTRFAATVGCLCRIDGTVPSTKGANDSMGRAVKHYEDWQQAIGIVDYMDGDNPFALEHAYIHEGFALFRGQPYFAEQL